MKIKFIFICLSLICIYLIAVGFSLAEVKRENIVGVWLFDEGQGQIAEEITKKSKDGVLNGGPKWVNGKFGKAIEFDGKADYVEIELPDVFNNIPNNNFTIAFWINVKDIAGSGTIWTRILEVRNDNLNYLQFVIQINDGELGINLMDEGTEKTVIVNSPIKADTWYYVAGVWDSKQKIISLYLGGIPQTGLGTTPASPGTEKIINLGRRSDGSNETYFNGIIDEFAIFNIALTEEEINSLMEGSIKPIAAVSSSGKLAITWGKIKNY